MSDATHDAAKPWVCSLTQQMLLACAVYSFEGGTSVFRYLFSLVCLQYRSRGLVFRIRYSSKLERLFLGMGSTAMVAFLGGTHVSHIR